MVDPEGEDLRVRDGSLLLHLQRICSGHIVTGDEALQARHQGFSHPPLSIPAGDHHILFFF